MSRISRQLSEAGLRLRKGLGQNFLVNQNALEKIAEAVPAGPESGVLEIGCGLGNLTELLARQAGVVLAVELDERFRPLHARALGELDNVQFAYADFMDLDLEAVLKPMGARPLHAVGNIPYNLTSPILFKLIESPVAWASVCLLMQREVAQRIQSSPGTRQYGILAIKVAVRFDAQRVFTISPGSFLPPPKVHSALVRFEPRAGGALIDDAGERKAFFHYVDAAFAQRRKMLPKSLAAGSGGRLAREAVEEALGDMGLEASVRAEALSAQEHIDLFRRLGSPRLPAVRADYGPGAARK